MFFYSRCRTFKQDHSQFYHECRAVLEVFDHWTDQSDLHSYTALPSGSHCLPSVYSDRDKWRYTKLHSNISKFYSYPSLHTSKTCLCTASICHNQKSYRSPNRTQRLHYNWLNTIHNVSAFLIIWSFNPGMGPHWLRTLFLFLGLWVVVIRLSMY